MDILREGHFPFSSVFPFKQVNTLHCGILSNLHGTICKNCKNQSEATVQLPGKVSQIPRNHILLQGTE